LKNTGPESASPASDSKPPAGGGAAAPAAKPATPAASSKLPPGATPVVQPGAATLDANSFGSDQDYQFVRAVDLLRGVTLFKRMAVQ
jgi:hypothetical protein